MVDAVFVSEPDNTPGVLDAPPAAAAASVFRASTDETLAAAWADGRIDTLWGEPLTAPPRSVSQTAPQSDQQSSLGVTI